MPALHAQAILPLSNNVNGGTIEKASAGKSTHHSSPTDDAAAGAQGELARDASKENDFCRTEASSPIADVRRALTI
jgi:hypothetical protein